MAWGAVSFLGAWLGFRARSGPLEGFLDLGSQGIGEGGAEGGGGMDTGIPWGAACLFPPSRNLGRG